MPGSNLSDEELQQLLDLLEAFAGSEEFIGAATPEDIESVGNARTAVNFARISRPGFDPKEVEYDDDPTEL